jgi:small subunit ribosomal protein S15
MLTVEKTQEIVKEFGASEKDTGNVKVQVALLTERIKGLTSHFGDHKHDYHSKRGLMKLIGRRKRFLAYIRKKSEQEYKDLIKELGLRK